MLLFLDYFDRNYDLRCDSRLAGLIFHHRFISTEQIIMMMKHLRASVPNKHVISRLEKHDFVGRGMSAANTHLIMSEK